MSELKATRGPCVADWYEQRHDLKCDQVFSTTDGWVVRLDRRVPGDGTKWYVADWLNGHWSFEDSTIEPGDLVERFPDGWNGNTAKARGES